MDRKKVTALLSLDQFEKIFLYKSKLILSIIYHIIINDLKPLVSS